MSNPFDLETGQFLVLINAERQFSLWPYTSDIPAGWTLAFGPNSKELCRDYIEREWTDIRARSTR